MAYIQQIPEKDKNQFGFQGETTPNPLPPQTGGSSGAVSSGQGSGVAPGMGTSQQFGSNAAKLSDYLKANEPQVAEFGNQVAGNLTQGYNQAKGAIDQGFGNFSQQVNQGYAPQNDDLVNQAATNPSEFVKNKDNVSAFQSLYNNQYSGPQNFESSDTYGNLNNEVNKANETAGLVNNFSGLGTYLNNTGKGGTTQGMNTLNTALLQRSPEASKAIKDAAKPYEGLSSYLGTKKNEANAGIANAKTTADQVKQAVQNRFSNEVVPNFQGTLDQRLQAARSKEDSEATAQQGFLSGGRYTTSGNPGDQGSFGMDEGELGKMLTDLGLNRNELAQLFQNRDIAAQGYVPPSGVNAVPGVNINLADYFTATPGAAMSLQNILSPEDVLTSQALAELSGNPELKLQSPVPGFNSSAFDKQGALTRVDALAKAVRDAASSAPQGTVSGGSTLQNPVQPKQPTGKPLDEDEVSKRKDVVGI